MQARTDSSSAPPRRGRRPAAELGRHMTAVSTTLDDSKQRRKGRRIKVLGALYISGIVAICVYMVLNWAEVLSRFQAYSYLGLFILGLLSGFSLPMPMPYMVMTFVLGGILQPALVAVSCGLGLGIGGTLLYLTGRGGRKFFPFSRLLGLVHSAPSEGGSPSFLARFFHKAKVPHMIALARRKGMWVVFLISAVPNPFFPPMAIALGTMRYHSWKFFLACWGGQTAKCLVISYCGYLGLGSVLRWTQLGI